MRAQLLTARLPVLRCDARTCAASGTSAGAASARVTVLRSDACAASAKPAPGHHAPRYTSRRDRCQPPLRAGRCRASRWWRAGRFAPGTAGLSLRPPVAGFGSRRATILAAPGVMVPHPVARAPIGGRWVVGALGGVSQPGLSSCLLGCENLDGGFHDECSSQERRERSASSWCRGWLPRFMRVHGMTRSESKQTMLCELAAIEHGTCGLAAGFVRHDRSRTTPRRARGRPRSRSPTGCSAASPRPRTWSRRRC